MRGARAASRMVIQGATTNWMKVNGSSTSRNVNPDSRTRIENNRPRSEVNVMSPKPAVVIVTSVQ